MKTIREIAKVSNRIVDLLAEESCTLQEAEDALKQTVLKIRATSKVQDSTHIGGLPSYNSKDKKRVDAEFRNLPFALDISFY